MIHFENLSDEEKVQLVIDQAIYITSIDYYNSIAKLYSLSGDFIEIQFDSFMVEVRSIQVLGLLELNRYLSCIDISDAFIYPNR